MRQWSLACGDLLLAAQGWACAMLLAVESRDDYDYGWLFGLVECNAAPHSARLARMMTIAMLVAAQRT